MSHIANDLWQEAAMESVEEHLEAGNWKQAEAIMADTRDNGFESTWREMLGMYNHYRFEDK
jgi:hypothetical protein